MKSLNALIELVNARAESVSEDLNWSAKEAKRFIEYMAQYTLARLSKGAVTAGALCQSEELLSQHFQSGVKAFQTARRRQAAAPPTSAVVNFDEVQDSESTAAHCQVELIIWLQTNVSDHRLRIVAEKLAAGYTPSEVAEEYGLTTAEMARIKASLRRKLAALRNA